MPAFLKVRTLARRLLNVPKVCSILKATPGSIPAPKILPELETEKLADQNISESITRLRRQCRSPGRAVSGYRDFRGY